MLNTVAPAGDINGDGVGDILVGGTHANSKAHIVFGQVEERTSNVDTITTNVVTFSYTDGAYLGYALSGGADLNDDGIPDILLGAHQATVTPEDGGTAMSSAGAVWMLPGPFFLTNPTTAPSVVPTRIPSITPSANPSAEPSVSPSETPSVAPSIQPTNPTAGPTARPTFLFVGDLNYFIPGKGARFVGSAPNSYVGQDVVQIGDHNGDGFNDYMIGAHVLSKAIIVMKRNTSYTEMDLSSIVSSQYFRVIVGPSGSQTGMAVGGVGDINGDSFDDVLVGAGNGQVSGRGSAGYAYVIFGMEGPFADLVLTDTWAASSLGFMILGPAGSVSFVSGPRTACGLGDVNGDGVDDFAVAARNYEGTSANTQPGVVWVIFGKTGSSFATIDLLPANFGTEGVYFTGERDNDYLGFSISSAGDFNGDGIPDILMGACGADPEVDGVTRTSGGAVYLMYGSNTSLITTDMSTFVTGSKGVRFLAASVGISLGFALSGVGDVNGDGFDDIAMGAPSGSPLGRGAAGTVYVIFGSSAVYTEDFDTLQLHYGAFAIGFPIYGGFDGRQLCTAAPAGDINEDGVDDILVGGFGGNSRAHIVFGQTAQRVADVDTATSGVFTFSFVDYSSFSWSLDGGADLNGDGIPDILLGAQSATVTLEGTETA
eukprot:gene39227-biopygen21278